MEYLAITGLNAPRYKEKASPLISISIIPNKLLSAPPPILLVFLNISNNIPDKLSNTPPAFLKVIGSFSTRAAMNIVYIGESELMIEQCIGVISGMATRNVSWVTKYPRNAARKILGISLNSTFSLGRKIESIQKSAPAPNDLNVKIAMGEISFPLVRSLQTIIFTPKIAYAIKHARCPVNILHLSESICLLKIK